MVLNDYRCPRCRHRLTRVSKWLGYCCESCRLAVTFIDKEKARITPMAGDEPQILPISALSATA
ncbi:hypothetical protein D3C87_1833020 [compost metagenome]